MKICLNHIGFPKITISQCITHGDHSISPSFLVRDAGYHTTLYMTWNHPYEYIAFRFFKFYVKCVCGRVVVYFTEELCCIWLNKLTQAKQAGVVLSYKLIKPCVNLKLFVYLDMVEDTAESLIGLIKNKRSHM